MKALLSLILIAIVVGVFFIVDNTQKAARAAEHTYQQLTPDYEEPGASLSDWYCRSTDQTTCNPR